MKRDGLYNIIMLSVTLLLPLLCSCEHKELCYQHPHVKRIRVAFDWQEAPEASPRGMCVYFYPKNGGVERRFDFRGMEGGVVELRVGTYRVICYNNDTEAVLFHDTDDFDLHGGYTREGNVLEPIYGNAAGYAPRADGTEDERVVIAPDMMWGCTAAEVEITDAGIGCVCVPTAEKEAGEAGEAGEVEPAVDGRVITLYPHELTCTYTYEVRNVENLEHAVQMCGTLSGMARSIRFGDESLGTECVTLPFGAASDGVSTITGKFHTFGHHEANAQPHRMAFYVVMDDGQKFAYGMGGSEHFNVTEQVHTAPDRRRVHIIIDGLELPAPIGDGGGFGVEVDGWDVVQEEVIL